MRVLQVVGSPSGQTGSFERHLLTLARRGAERGTSVQLCYPEPLPDTTYRAAVRQDGIPVWTRAARGRLDVAFVRWVADLVREQEIDVVHGHFEPGSHLAAAAGRLAGRPVVLTRHYLAGNSATSAHALSTRVAGSLCARFLAVSDPVRGSLLRYGVADRKAVTAPLGVDLGVFHPRPVPERAAVRERLGIAPEAALVVGTSHHREGKGVETLVDAMAHAPGVVLALAGEGPRTPMLKQRAAALPADVRFLGRVDDVAALLGAADLFCLPTVDYPEGLPMAVLEAMAMGLPVVATPVPAVVPLLTGEPTAGVVVPAGDARALGSALAQLAADDARRHDLGEAARERSAAFEVGRMADAVLDLYDELAG